MDYPQRGVGRWWCQASARGSGYATILSPEAPGPVRRAGVERDARVHDYAA
jgi:hypothetical protein